MGNHRGIDSERKEKESSKVTLFHREIENSKLSLFNYNATTTKENLTFLER